MAYYDSSLNTIYGGSELNAYVTDPLTQQIITIQETIDQSIQGALDKIIGPDGNISYETKPLNEIAAIKPNTGAINMNNKRIENLATLDISTIDSIIATPSSGVNVQTMTSYNTFNVPIQIASLTNTILPLSTTTSMKGRTIINAANPRSYNAQTPSVDIIERIQDVVTVSYLNDKTLHKDLDGKYTANNQKIEDLADATLYIRSNIYDQVPDPIEQNVFSSVLNPAKQLEYDQMAMNLKSVQDVSVSLNVTDRAAYDSKAKQIKNGMQATLPKDYVTLDQVCHQEENKLSYAVTLPVPQVKTAEYINEKRIMFVKDPVFPTGGQFLEDKTIPGFISQDKQVVNVGYISANCHLKGGAIDMGGYNIIDMAAPGEYHHAVNKSYCDSNRDKSSKPDGTGSVIGPILGTLGGAVAGGLTSLFTNGGAGLSALGSLSGALGAVGSVFQGGIQVGSSAAFKPENFPAGSQGERLIDNLQDDIANGGSADNAQGAGSLVSGPLAVSGLLSSVRNAALGLFDFV